MLTDAERREKIAQIGSLPSSLEEALAGLDEAQIDTPYRSGGWTVRQVVHHLADSHMNAFVRMKLVITEDTPTLKPYNQDEWAVQADAMKTPLLSSVSILKGLHERWVTLLENVAESGWARTAMHPENGEMTLDDLLSLYGRHGESHVKQIIGLREEKGWLH